jgi:HD-like signal output (HDOD) protein
MIVLIFAFLIGLIIVLMKLTEGKVEKNEAIRSGKKYLRGRLVSTKVEKADDKNQRSEKSERIYPLKSTVQEGINYITSSPVILDSKSTKPHQLSELSQDIIDSVKSQVGDMREFASVHEMSLMLDDPNVDMSKVARKISTDPVLSNKILKVANSVYFGSRIAIDSINHALIVLGLINIKSIFFYNVLSKQSYAKQAQKNPMYRSLWKHSVLTAICGFYVADAFEGLNKGKLYTLGLLHDIGKFIRPGLIRENQIDHDFLIPFGEKESIASEEELLGVNHAVIGRIAFEECGLSERMLRLIEIHHFPSFYSKGYLSMKEEDKKYLTALYLANQIAKLFVDEDEKKIYAAQSLPISYLDLVNLSKLKNVFSDNHVLSEIMKAKDLTENYIISDSTKMM